MILLFDNKQKLIDELAKEQIKSATDELILNGQITARIAYPYTLFDKATSYFAYKYDNNFYYYKVMNTTKENGLIYLTGIHIFFDELKGKIVRDKRPTNVTALQACEAALEGTGWEVISTVDETNSTNFYYITVLEAIYKIIEVWSCEIKIEIDLGSNNKINRRRIILAKSISNDFGKWFEYGDKLLTVVAEENHADIATALIGRGKGEETDSGYGRKITFNDVVWTKPNDPVNKPAGQDYVELAEATSLYGYPGGVPRIAIVDFPDYDNPDELLQATYDHLINTARPKLQLKAKAISDKRVDVGEVCSIIRPDLDIRYKTKVFKVKRNLISNAQEFEFGDKINVSGADRIKAQIAAEMGMVNRIESVREAILAQITNFYWNEDGYNYELKVNNEYGLPAGYYSFDKPIEEDPGKVIYIGAGKMLIANEKNADGEWAWVTAATADGIAGNSIVANSITANQLEADVGQSLDLASNESVKILVTETVSDEISPITTSFFVDNLGAHVQKTGSETEVLIDDTGIKILVNGIVTAHFIDGESVNDNVKINEQLRFKNWIWEEDEVGNFNLRKG